jgi:hypothetical protein
LKFRVLPPAVIASVLMGMLLLGSPCSGVVPAIPPGPYIPKSAAEDIVMVEAYIEQGVWILHLKVTFAAPTPPAGQTLNILVTYVAGNPPTENVIHSFSTSAGSSTTYNLNINLCAAELSIAVYAWLTTPGTDRAPDTGFQRITSLSGAAPNRFSDFDSVGGVVLPTNSLAVLAPYLAMIGLVATAGVVVKKRRQ